MVHEESVKRVMEPVCLALAKEKRKREMRVRTVVMLGRALMRDMACMQVR